MFPINLYQRVNMPVDELMEVLIEEAEKSGMSPDESYGFAAAVLKYLDKEEQEEAQAALQNSQQIDTPLPRNYPPLLKRVK